MATIGAILAAGGGVQHKRARAVALRNLMNRPMRKWNIDDMKWALRLVALYDDVQGDHCRRETWEEVMQSEEAQRRFAVFCSRYLGHTSKVHMKKRDRRVCHGTHDVAKSAPASAPKKKEVQEKSQLPETVVSQTIPNWGQSGVLRAPQLGFRRRSY